MNERLQARTFIVVCLALGLGVGCTSERTSVGPIQVRDDGGNTVSLPAAPQRIISLVPSVTETVMALGAVDRLVARTEYDKDPRISELPSLGGGLNPNAEALASFRPDLLLAWTDSPDSDGSGAAARLGIPVYRAEVQSLEDFYRTVDRVGTLLDLDEEAETLVQEIREELAAIRAQVATRPKPTVLYVVWHDPAQVAGPGSYLDSLIEIAGGVNAFGDAPTAWPQISLEELVRRDPDFVVAAGSSRQPTHRPEWLQAPGWRDLTAAKEGRVFVVDADLFNRPGPRVGEAARALAGILHGAPPETASVNP
jgi:iron complex transport system substrate-binding protein